MEAKKFLELKKESERLRKEIDQFDGMVFGLINRLEKEYGHKHVEGAREELEKLERELKESEEKYKKSLEEYREKWNGMLEQS